MGVLYFKMLKSIIFFLLLVYFIPIVVGPPFQSVVHEICYNQIYDTYQTAIGPEDLNKSYFYYALFYLRYPRPQEVNAYKRSLAPEHQENDQYFKFLLLNNINDGQPIINEEFSFKYFKFMSNKFNSELPQYLSPLLYCKGVPECEYTLGYFGLIGDVKAIVSHAYSNIVQSDFTPNVPFRNDGMKMPTKPSIGYEYLCAIAGKLTMDNSNMKNPYEYCKDPV